MATEICVIAGGCAGAKMAPSQPRRRDERYEKRDREPRPRKSSCARLRRSGGADGGALDLPGVGPHRPVDVLEALLAEVDKVFVQLVAHLLVGGGGQADAAWFALDWSRAATLTPSPIRSPSTSSTTSPR